jgi:hypothetical protein
VGSDLVVVFAAIIWRKDYRGGRNAVTHTCRSNTLSQKGDYTLSKRAPTKCFPNI